MFCLSCGNHLPEECKFCPFCGIAVDAEEPSVPAPVSIPIPASDDAATLPAAKISSSAFEEEATLPAAKLSAPVFAEEATLPAAKIPAPIFDEDATLPAEKTPVYGQKIAPPAPPPAPPVYVQPPAAEPPKKEKVKQKKPEKKKKSSAAPLVCAILFAILTVALAALNVLQYLQNTQLSSEIEDLEQTVSTNDQTILDLKTTISDQEDTLEEQADQIDALDAVEFKADFYDRLISQPGERLGYASKQFNTAEGSLFLKKGDGAAKLTLNAKFGEGTRVSVSYPPDSCASLTFNEKDWSQTTTVSIKPENVGATLMTFTNSVNDESFQLLVVVTE